MNGQWQLDRCVNHRDIGYDHHAKRFITTYFSDKNVRILLIAGAGFDPRTTRVCKLIADSSKDKLLQGLLITENRPHSNNELLARAEPNIDEMRKILSNNTTFSINIFAVDGAVIGGREVTKSMCDLPLNDFTDIVIDISAMSIGIAYPMIRYLFEILKSNKANKNLHVMVTDNPAVDSKIIPIASDKVGTVFGFHGGLGLDPNIEAVKLWLPQLILGRKSILDKIHMYIPEPKDICPILPLSESDPKLSDKLIDYYKDEFESTWEVDGRSIIYVDERNPLDLYRTILQIDDARRRVFASLTGSTIVLSPVGSKASAIGALMAAIERDYPVVYAEPIDYTVDFDELDQCDDDSSRIVHVWLYGNVYP